MANFSFSINKKTVRGSKEYSMVPLLRMTPTGKHVPSTLLSDLPFGVQGFGAYYDYVQKDIYAAFLCEEIDIPYPNPYPNYPPLDVCLRIPDPPACAYGSSRTVFKWFPENDFCTGYGYPLIDYRNTDSLWHKFRLGVEGNIRRYWYKYGGGPPWSMAYCIFWFCSYGHPTYSPISNVELASSQDGYALYPLTGGDPPAAFACDAVSFDAVVDIWMRGFPSRYPVVQLYLSSQDTMYGGTKNSYVEIVQWDFIESDETGPGAGSLYSFVSGPNYTGVVSYTTSITKCDYYF